MKILIADDEALARQRLQSLLKEISGDFTILATANNGLEALNQCISEKPDLALLDIRMPKMDGLQAAAEIIKANLNIPVVFITAYDEHALAAFDNNAIDYLLKPVKKQRLEAMLEKAKHFRFSPQSSLEQLPLTSTTRKYLCSHSHQGTNIIDLNHILCFKADSKYVSAITATQTFLLDEPLKALEEEFSGAFFRVHRNALVNISAIKLLNKSSAGQHQVILDGLEQPVAVSRRHQAKLGKFLRESSR
ncbi:MAG: DNA-binding response regulator [Cycloclasticus sp. symbiont of Bathymodiolus heckerae]|nr:MAG: DNA-binding response regulator [Cycloclasticus sp. symbiont of Bathymodiolus heckerae]